MNLSITNSRQAIIVAIFTLITISSVTAQPTATNRGRNFYCSFLPNFHDNARDVNPASRFSDSLFIFIGADIPTSGTIYCTDREGVTLQFPFFISNPTQIYSFALPWQNYELQGGNTHGVFTADSLNQAGQIAKQHFRIESNNDVTVYALNQAYRTSDAFLLLPVEALGTEYRVLCYNSDGYISSSAIDKRSTPSEFAITATEDNTQVIINLSTVVYPNRNTTDTIIMQHGETYLIQAEITPKNLRGDLTGSKIVSNKPIAVFAGHQRALLPVEYRSYGISSRDHIVEQMPPLSAWGKSAILTPYPQPFGITYVGNDLYRVLAAFDSTEVFVGGIKKKTLAAGQFFTDLLLTPAELKASKPVLVAQYKKTSMGPGSFGFGLNSDPFMMIIPPKEQFMLSYRCINAQALQFNNSSTSLTYTEQYIIVVAPQSAISTVRLDGLSVANTVFKEISGSTFMYATLKVGDGTHSLSADEPFGIYVFGYGYVNSYGYVGGMSFKEFDYKEPEIFSTLDCFRTRGVVLDTHRTDSRIVSVTAPQDSQKNVTVTIDPFTPYSDSVHFSATLTDKFQDGECTIIAKDSIGFVTSKKTSIPGFTLSSTIQLPGGQLPEITTDGPLKRSYCFPVTVTNYGSFPQIITNSNFHSSSDKFSIQSKLPITIEPKATKEITVCFYSDYFGIYSDTLSIGNDCVSNRLIAIVVTAIPDKTPPVISQVSSPCPDPIEFTIAESLPSDLGIEKIVFIDSLTKNCSVITSVGDGYQTLNLTVSPTNPDEDAFFAFKVTDSAGNISSVFDTIPGFTLRLAMPNAPLYRLDFGETMLGELSCREVELQNYGQFTLNFINTGLSQNRIFSIPPSQLPALLVQPKDTNTMNMCYAPIRVDNFTETDTLHFHFGCRTKSLILQGKAKPNIQSVTSRCDIPVRVITVELPQTYGNSSSYLGQNIPNPTTGNSTVSFAFSEQTTATITLYDAIGKPVGTLASGDFGRGVYEITIDLEKFPDGVYYYQLQTSKERTTRILTLMH